MQRIWYASYPPGVPETVNPELRGTKAAGFWSNIERLEKYYSATYPPDAAG